MQTDWLNMLDEYWDERDTPYSDDVLFWSEWQFQYYNELQIFEDFGSAYLIWKSEQHRLTPKYDIMHSLAALVKHYLVTMEEDDNQTKAIF